MTLWRDTRGTALLEAAVTIPLLLLVSVGIFEFGRAYQTWQVLTNVAREGARIAVLPNSTTNGVETRVRQYMQDGQLPGAGTAAVTVSATTYPVNGTNVAGSQVTVDYPFQFIVLPPVASLVSPGTQAGDPITMRATAQMRNEAQ